MEVRYVYVVSRQVQYVVLNIKEEPCGSTQQGAAQSAHSSWRQAEVRDYMEKAEGNITQKLMQLEEETKARWCKIQSACEAVQEQCEGIKGRLYEAEQDLKAAGSEYKRDRNSLCDEAALQDSGGLIDGALEDICVAGEGSLQEDLESPEQAKARRKRQQAPQQELITTAWPKKGRSQQVGDQAAWKDGTGRKQEGGESRFAKQKELAVVGKDKGVTAVEEDNTRHWETRYWAGRYESTGAGVKWKMNQSILTLILGAVGVLGMAGVRLIGKDFIVQRDYRNKLEEELRRTQLENGGVSAPWSATVRRIEARMHAEDVEPGENDKKSKAHKLKQRALQWQKE